MTMKLAPIRLRSYFLTELHLQARPEFDPTKESGWKDNGFTVEQKVKPLDLKQGAPREWQIDLSIQHQPGVGDNFPYSFRLMLVGFFQGAPELAGLDETTRERILRINGTSILYGAAREIVRAATGRGPHAPVLLPTVSFWEPPPKPPQNAVGKESEQTQRQAAKPRKRRETKRKARESGSAGESGAASTQ